MKVGDIVRCGNFVGVVVRVNKKTVRVESLLGGAFDTWKKSEIEKSCRKQR